MRWVVICAAALALTLPQPATGRDFPVPIEFPSGAAPPTFPLICEWLQRIAQQLDPSATSVEIGRQAVLAGIRTLDNRTLARLQLAAQLGARRAGMRVGERLASWMRGKEPPPQPPKR